ncbi:MAG: hypothetical protein IPM29_30455 [Planctomycetes bacterium]|nr:hypothetical protein [Planctomycetota bacterium]
MGRSRYQVGEPVVFAKQKTSQDPGPRARAVRPAPRGDDYTYFVDKLWVVEKVLDDGRLQLATRRGKRHVVDARDPALRRPTLWERLKFRLRFPRLERIATDGDPGADATGASGPGTS